jgi:hypothetical protein
MAELITKSVYRTASKAISCTKQFYISTSENENVNSKLLFQTPSYSVIKNNITGLGLSVHFSISKSDLDMINRTGLPIHHISEYIRDLSSRNFSYEGSRLYVYLVGNCALFIVKRITDYLFTQIFNFDSAEDLLYYIQSCFNQLSLDKRSDQLILCGEINEDSKIIRLLSIYFSNLVTETSIPFSILSE